MHKKVNINQPLQDIIFLPFQSNAGLAIVKPTLWASLLDEFFDGGLPSGSISVYGFQKPWHLVVTPLGIVVFPTLVKRDFTLLFETLEADYAPIIELMQPGTAAQVVDHFTNLDEFNWWNTHHLLVPFLLSGTSAAVMRASQDPERPAPLSDEPSTSSVCPLTVGVLAKLLASYKQTREKDTVLFLLTGRLRHPLQLLDARSIPPHSPYRMSGLSLPFATADIADVNFAFASDVISARSVSAFVTRIVREAIERPTDGFYLPFIPEAETECTFGVESFPALSRFLTYELIKASNRVLKMRGGDRLIIRERAGLDGLRLSIHYTVKI